MWSLRYLYTPYVTYLAPCPSVSHLYRFWPYPIHTRWKKLMVDRSELQWTGHGHMATIFLTSYNWYIQLMKRTKNWFTQKSPREPTDCKGFWWIFKKKLHFANSHYTQTGMMNLLNLDESLSTWILKDLYLPLYAVFVIGACQLSVAQTALSCFVLTATKELHICPPLQATENMNCSKKLFHFDVPQKGMSSKCYSGWSRCGDYTVNPHKSWELFTSSCFSWDYLYQVTQATI